MSHFTIPVERRTYHLYSEESLNVLFFANADRFRHFLEDHVLSDSEPWWERLIHVKFRNSLGQKVGSGDVSIAQAGLDEAFAACVPVLDRGISFSVGFPVYVAFAERRRKAGSPEWHESRGYYFVSEDGLLIVVRADVLRTAHFCAGIKGWNLSKKELFYEAWKSAKDIGLNRLIRDSKGGDEYKHVALSHVTPENWRRCPDPKRRRDPRKERIAGRSIMERTTKACQRLLETLEETKTTLADDYHRTLREETIFERMVELVSAYHTEFDVLPINIREDRLEGMTEEEIREYKASLQSPDVTLLSKAVSIALDDLKDIDKTLEEAAHEAVRFVLARGY